MVPGPSWAVLLLAPALFIYAFTDRGYPAGSPASEALHSDADYVKWRGDFHYKLDYQDGLYDHSVEFMKMKGLVGETDERIEVEGQIVFTEARKEVNKRMVAIPGRFAGEGNVTYSIARMSLSGIGEAKVVYFTDGKGKDQISGHPEDTYLKIDRGRKSYSFRISPGSYEADIDAFGVKVLESTEMKVTSAFIEKMESEGRPVLFPEALKEMFPEYEWSQGRDHIVLEAFDIPLPGPGNALRGTYEDEKGGVLSWNFTSF